MNISRQARAFYFYPRSPCGERLVKLVSNSNITTNFYPRSPCGERLFMGWIFGMHLCISIHALLAESDAFLSGSIKFLSVFLSTLSLRRATAGHQADGGRRVHFYPRSPCGERPSYSQHVMRPSGYFYPRSPCGERPVGLNLVGQMQDISIHALLAESDKCRTSGTLML